MPASGSCRPLSRHASPHVGHEGARLSQALDQARADKANEPVPQDDAFIGHRHELPEYRRHVDLCAAAGAVHYQNRHGLKCPRTATVSFSQISNF